MKKINLIALTDIEHSSPRITNLLYYLDNNKFNKYIIGADYANYLNENDFPENFFKKIKYISFKRRFNMFQFIKRNIETNKKENIKKSTSNLYIIIKKKLIRFILTIMFPDQYIFTLKSYLKEFNKLVNTLDGPIVIISSNPYPTSLIAGFFVKRKYKHKILWLADYRDLWTLNHNYSFNRIRKFFDGKLEKLLLKKADVVTTVSESLLKAQSKFLSREINLLYNGYSISKQHNSNLDDYNSIHIAKQKKYILHVGSLYLKFMNINLLISSLKENLKNNFEIHFIGNFSLDLQKIIDDNNLSKFIKQIGKFNRSESIIIQKKYDFLIMFDSEYDSGVLPLKFFEYIQSTRPIICIGGKKDSEVKKILNKINRGIILENLEQVYDFFSNKIFSNSQIDLTESNNFPYSYKSSSNQLERIIFHHLNQNKLMK